MILRVQKKANKVSLLNSSIIIKEFGSGALSIEVDESNIEGNFPTLDRNDENKVGKITKFYIKGFPQLITSIDLIEFEESTNYLVMDKNYGGSEWLWNQLNNRLKLGIYESEKYYFANLKIAKLKIGTELNTNSRFTWQNLAIDSFEEETMLPNSLKFLADNGIKIGKKSEVLDTNFKRDGNIIYWNKENIAAPGIIYFLICFFPLYLNAQKFTKPQIRIINDVKISRDTMFYNLDELLSSGEKDTIECKSSVYFSANSKTPPTKINFEIIRTIVGMLNAKGGTLLIGVAEESGSKNYRLKGIKGDFDWMNSAEEDPVWTKKMGKLTGTWEDYQKVLRKEIMDRIGRTFFNSCIMINFEDIGYSKQNPICRIDIEPAPQPVSDEKGLKHIRFANGTQLLPKDQEDEYFKNRFPNLSNVDKDVNKLNV